jgi:alcohol dehydrogenase YqhD (iron-dependent ADH family)
MSIRFTSEWQRCRVVFGPGARTTLGTELDSLGVGRALIVRSPGRNQFADEIVGTLQHRLAGVCAMALPHVPAPSVTAALAETDRVKPDGIVAIGGGSAIGLAKAIALNRSLPVIALPTTYAGSEMTSVYGMTEGGQKRTGRDARVAPRLVIYDPDLTMSLPAGVSAASGMNAIAHAVEAMYAANVARCHASSQIRLIPMPARSRSEVLISPAFRSSWPRWGCITRFVTSLAGHLDYRTQRRTLYCCRVSWRSMRRPPRTRWPALPRRWVPATPRRACGI